MATPTQIRAAVDTKLTQLWAAIQNREDTYFAANARYWQGLVTHSIQPADGATVAPDVGNATPVGTQTPWPSAILSQLLPMSLEIHEYITPDGTAGYVAFARVTIGGNTWERAQAVGPEAAARTHAWSQLVVLP